MSSEYHALALTPSTPSVKYCPKCQTEKPLVAFYKAPNGKPGYRTPCIACRLFREKHPYPKSATEKVCTACGVEKPLDQFNINSTGRYGRSSRCTDCINAWHKQRYTETHQRRPQPVNGGKICTTCSVEKPLEQFYPSKHGSLGRESECIMCMRARKKREKMAKPEQYKAMVKRYRKRQPDRYKAEMRKGRLKRFALTPEQYQAMFDAQDGVCAICKQPETSRDHLNREGKNLAIDHCHKTGVIRGLLCARCNAGIGQFQDSIDRLSSAIVYLQRRQS